MPTARQGPVFGRGAPTLVWLCADGNAMPDRNIKQSCRTSRTLNKLSNGAERLFWRLTTVADDYGRFDANPVIVKANCFPLRVDSLDTSVVEEWLVELRQAPLIVVYDNGERQYGQFQTWLEHQGPPRAKKSKFPSPQGCGKLEQATRTESVDDAGDSVSANNCFQMSANVPVFRSPDINIKPPPYYPPASGGMRGVVCKHCRLPSVEHLFGKCSRKQCGVCGHSTKAHEFGSCYECTNRKGPPGRCSALWKPTGESAKHG